LNVREAQAARYGSNAAPEVVTDIEDLTVCIEDLRNLLRLCEMIGADNVTQERITLSERVLRRRGCALGSIELVDE